LAFSYFRYSDKTAARILSGFWPEGYGQFSLGLILHKKSPARQRGVLRARLIFYQGVF
jgi:hypothetical protein